MLSMTNTSKKKQNYTNILESLKGIGAGAAQGLKNDILRPSDFAEQIFGIPQKKNYSGEISKGESLDMSNVFSGKQEENNLLRTQLTLERNMRQDEQIRSQRKAEELRVELHALIQEVKALANSSSNLAEEVQIAAMQAPVEPGVYHLVFFEKLIEFIKDFRKKIEDASVWLHATNKRAQKKNYWTKYKKHGGKFLLSADHYLTRSAG